SHYFFPDGGKARAKRPAHCRLQLAPQPGHPFASQHPQLLQLFSLLLPLLLWVRIYRGLSVRIFIPSSLRAAVLARCAPFCFSTP
ncbi:MAG: hypothetical protein LBK99_04555, partial [Opitutaceae bacterium]|nr:hypothetical protein [Opitutaceae bacterium]